MPELRHDWRIPAASAAVGPLVASLFEGWLPSGIGSVQAYPTFYLIGIALWPLHSLLSGQGLAILLVGGAAFLIARATMSLTAEIGSRPPAQTALATFACVNPWVYAKYVAGHVLMIFAYGILIALAAEALRARPRVWLAVVLAAFSITQIEFFIIAAPMILVWAIRRRAWTVATALLCAALPIAAGLIASYGDVRGIPFELAWQRSQSVDLAKGVLLLGYFPPYERAFAPLYFVSVALAVAAVAGVANFRRDRRYAGIVFISGIALIVSSGTKGPLAVPYAWLVVHVPEIGVFRELYDLIALVAIGTIVLLASGAGRWKPGAYALTILCGMFAIAWMVVPPSTFFVDADRLPSSAFPAIPQDRVALEPAFQPMTANGLGSGVDPDAYPRSGFASPINEVFPTFPVDAALGFATFRNDDRELGALGVDEIIARPYLQTDFSTLRFQWIAMNASRARNVTRRLVALPLLSLSAKPVSATIANRPDENAIFFGDEQNVQLGRFRPDPSVRSAKTGWADARLAVPMHPDWGTAFGGVATESKAALSLPLASDQTSLLAETDGTIRDDRGTVVAFGSNELHWWPMRPDRKSVSCEGTCVVILQSVVPRTLPEHHYVDSATPVVVDFLTPWLGSATLPAGTRGLLRLNIGYAGAWQAYAGIGFLEHLRVDTAFNGWVVPRKATAHPVRIVFVETVAALQMLLEVFAVGAIFALSTYEWRRERALREHVG